MSPKHYVLTNANGITVAVVLAEANRYAVKQPLPLLNAILPIGGKRGATKRKPSVYQSDRGYGKRLLLLSVGVRWYRHRNCSPVHSI